MNNRRGFTLIEVLAVIVLTFIVGSLVFSILSQSLNNYEQSELRSKAQTDVNRLLFQITTVHQSGSTYTINQTNNSQISLNPTNDEVSSVSFNGEPFQYEITIDSIPLNDSKTIDPTEETSFDITVVVRQQGNDRFNPLEVNSSISRIQAGGDDS
ncbi:type II secretion system protein J [Alkalibacillus sp. S2W]|uniref:PulJ/GspJ family protein n=1 Tax=Alkalibacillus sp. S2W TaxID=3386553 RepID=UPI00398D15D4